jgi:hypothetical protein
MPAQRQKSRADQAIDLAREAREMAIEAVAHVQAHRFMITTMLAVMRDLAILPTQGIQNIFIGAAGVIDRIVPGDEATEETLAASRNVVEEMASNFGIEVPQKGQVVLPRRH